MIIPHYLDYCIFIIGLKILLKIGELESCWIHIGVNFYKKILMF